LPKIFTLKQAIEQALTLNGTMRSSLMEIENQKVLRQSAWNIDKTNVGFQYGQFNSNARDNEFTVTQTFEFPTTYINQDRLAKASIKSAEIKSEFTRNEIIGQVKATYYKLIYCSARLKLLEFQDSLYGNFLHAARMRFQKGETTLLEKITAESQLLAVKNLIKQALADIHIEECKLQTLLNERSEIQIADSVLTKLMLVVPDDSLSLRSNPVMSYLEQQTRLFRLEKQVASSKLAPDLMIGYFNQSNKDISGQGRFDGLQAGIGIPVFFASQKGKIESAKMSEAIAQNNFEFQRTTLRHQLHILIQEYYKYSESLQYYENSALQQAVIIIEQADKSYKSGAIDYMEYVQNLRQGIDIKNNYLETLNAYNQSVILIEKLINRY
jgi:cobalt-zinc-cadmium resistance protein CzcA